MDQFTVSIGLWRLSETHLEAENAEQMRPPDELEPHEDDFRPRRAVLGHTCPGDSDQRLDAVLQARSGDGLRAWVGQLTVVHPVGSKSW